MHRWIPLFFAAFSMLFVVKIIPIFGKPLTEKYVRYNDVRGVTVELDGKPYTLNFKQQNALIAKINEATEHKEFISKSTSKVIIHRFHKPDLILETDITLKKIIFLVPEWEQHPLITSYDLSTLK